MPTLTEPTYSIAIGSLSCFFHIKMLADRFYITCFIITSKSKSVLLVKFIQRQSDPTASLISLCNGGVCQIERYNILRHTSL